jgi:hypothetical protein
LFTSISLKIQVLLPSTIPAFLAMSEVIKEYNP